MATVSDLLAQRTGGPLTLSPTTTVLDAASQMNERGTGSVLVAEGDRLVGIFTERDLMRRVVAVRRDPATTLLGDVMTTALVSCRPDATLDDCAALMSERRIRHLPVVEGGRLIGLVSIVMGIGAMGQNIAFLVALAFAVAASANLPTILYSLFWKRFNTTGALFSMYGGLISTLVLIALSPAVSGSEKSMISSVDFSIFPLANPGIVSIPLAFTLGIVGTFIGKKDEFPLKRQEMEVRSLTGVGVEKTINH